MKAESSMNTADVAFELADKTLKAPVFIGSLWSGAFAALGSIVTGEGAALTAVMVAASSVLGALFAKLPDIIKARAESKKVEVNLHDDGQSKLIEQIYKNQDRESAAKEKYIQRLEAENLILRTTKHEALNECHVLSYWIYELRDLCVANRIAYPEHSLRDVADLVRNEDDQMKQISDTRNTTPARS